MKILEVVPNPGYELMITAEGGRVGRFDVTPYLASEAFKLLKDRGEFERVHNGGYFIEWDCGADLTADTIEARWDETPGDGVAQQGAPADAATRRG